MSFGFTSKKAESNGHTAPPSTPSMPSARPPMPKTPAPRSNVAAAPSAQTSRPIDRAQPSMIGIDVTILGNLISRGELQIDGEVQGDLHGTHIVVGEKARIEGGIIGEEVVIRGQVNGSVRGRKVMLQSSSHVEGDVHHEWFAIEQGAYFEGKSRRSDDPLAGTPPLPTGKD